jgi:penicillin-binding protein 2
VQPVDYGASLHPIDGVVMTLATYFRDDLRRRIQIVVACFVLCLVLLVGRLVILQCFPAAALRVHHAGHGVRLERIVPARGAIVDRHGQALVTNQPAYDVVAIPQYLGSPTAVATTLTHLTTVRLEDWQSALAVAKRVPAYRPLLLYRALDRTDAVRILAWQSPWQGALPTPDLRGIFISDHGQRHYPHGSLAPHVLGYLKEIDGAQLERLRATHPVQYARGDDIGANGLEARWDRLLRGIPGEREHLVDARGYAITRPDWMVLQTTPPQSGATLRLTLDTHLQDVAHAALGDATGAIVALDPHSGAVRALVSHPTYDLAQLQGEARRAYWQTLTQDARKPLFDRAVLGQYPPGSIYKIVVAAAALAEGVTSPNERITCHGGVQLGGRRFGCWRRSGHGAVNLHAALAGSCDVYFYRMGQRLGPDRIAVHARRFGLGQPTGIDLPHEATGLIPTRAWKAQRYARPWTEGDSLSIAIGQGYDLMTPLQAATMVAVIANGGYRVVPYLVEQIGTTAPKHHRPLWHSILQHRAVVHPEIVRHIHGGIVAVVQSPHGTARRLHALRRDIAGKTGTAQVISLDKGSGRHIDQDHAWFVAYAPAANPQIAVSVIVEHGGSGSKTAAPIAGKMIEAYFQAQEEHTLAAHH